jgi:hypothetical protein
LTCIAIYFLIIRSCVRFVQQQTGMPPHLQANFSEQYKIDPIFARDVDQLRSGANGILGE